VNHPTFRQLATLLGGTYSASSMAVAEGLSWPPAHSISLRGLLSFRPTVKSIAPPTEPPQPPPTIGPGYIEGPAALMDPSAEGRVTADLRDAAQDRDGNKILRRVADRVAGNFAKPGSTSQDLITAMTQLAVTGSRAFAAWSANPQDLTPYLIQRGMPAAEATAANRRIMSDFDAARNAVRSPQAGVPGIDGTYGTSLRHTLQWVAVSGEDDPPDYPVNVDIAQYPQYHLPITVPTPQGVSSSIDVSIRYILASSQTTSAGLDQPHIPPGDEVVLYIHGEGSRAEEAGDFIPALFSVAATAGRSFTVIAFDQPSCGYSTMVPHLSVAPAPNTSGVSGVVDTSSFSGSPILDFVESAIVVFVEKLLVPFGNRIAAIVGGSLGGHMALRLCASQKTWVGNVIAWSPASVMDHDFFLGFNIAGKPLGPTFDQRLLADPVLATRWSEGPNPPWPASRESSDTRSDFFSTVWDKATFDPTYYDLAGAAAALLVADVFSGLLGSLGAGAIADVLAQLPTVPAQPKLWYRESWPSKLTYIEESRRDRREVYNADFRQWHWRICAEMIGFKFDALLPGMNKPLLLMVGEEDNYAQVHFLSNVTAFAAKLTAPAQGALTIQNTGHSIHNERPYFLAHQVVKFT
jgi:pimeloyl-ACP methyl ester carboxylesterase